MAPVSEGGPKQHGHLGPRCASAHRRSGYSSFGCVPAEPNSASPDTNNLSLLRENHLAPLVTFRGSYQHFIVIPRSMFAGGLNEQTQEDRAADQQLKFARSTS
jgi:hypothetical protein